jgi:hypothetical protein
MLVSVCGFRVCAGCAGTARALAALGAAVYDP